MRTPQQGDEVLINDERYLIVGETANPAAFQLRYRGPGPEKAGLVVPVDAFAVGDARWPEHRYSWDGSAWSPLSGTAG